MTFESDVPPVLRIQLDHAERILAAAGTPAPRDEALALLASLLGVPPALLLAHADGLMSQTDAEAYAAWTARRAAGEAIPHITGHLAFMGLDLRVERDTPLIPPGAQRLVEVALERARHHARSELAAAELGTGCGAIALALAAFEPRFSRIYAVDATPRSLRMATANGARYLLNLVISWLEGEGLDVVPEPVDLVVCNRFVEAPAPQLALFLEQSSAKLRPGGALVCGLARAHAPEASEVLARSLPGAQVWVDSPAAGGIIVVAQLPRA